MKQNCLEFKKCGREPSGAKVKKFGICPASTDKRLDGVTVGRIPGVPVGSSPGLIAKEIKANLLRNLGTVKNATFITK